MDRALTGFPGSGRPDGRGYDGLREHCVEVEWAWGVSSSSSAIASHSSSDSRPARKLSAAAWASFSFGPLELIATDELLGVSLIREVMAMAICTFCIVKSISNILESR